MLLTVDLDARLAIDDEVDALIRLERNLRRDVMPGEAKPRTRNALGERLAVRIDPVDYGAQPDGKSLNEAVEVGGIHQPGVQRPVKHCHRLLERLVEDYHSDRVSQSDAPREATFGDVGRVPVKYYATARSQPAEPVGGGAHPRCVGGHGDMQRGRVHDPAIKIMDESETGKAPSDPYGLNGAVVCGESCIPALASTDHFARADSHREVQVLCAVSHELLLLRETTECRDEGCDIHHRITLAPTVQSC